MTRRATRCNIAPLDASNAIRVALSGSMCVHMLHIVSRCALCSTHSYCCQVLHVATLRQHAVVVRSLIGGGFPVMKQNSRGWMALDEAVSLKDSELVSLGLLTPCMCNGRRC